MAVPSGSHKGWAYDNAGRLRAMFNGTEVFDFDANDMVVTQPTTFSGAVTFSSTATVSGAQTYADDVDLSFGTSADVDIVWETADANANELIIELPPGDATNVPVVVIGDTLKNDDLGQYNGVVSTTVAIHGSTATATGPSLTFKKSRGTNSAPTAVTSGDDAGSIDFYGAVAADEYVRSVRILAETTGTIATTRGPDVLTFQTATDAAPSVLTTGLTISAAQALTMPVGPLTIGTAGTTTGNLRLAGATSGYVELRATDAAGTITFILPAAVGSNGEQLTTNGNAGTATTSWAAAASLREFKNVLGDVSNKANEALQRVMSRPVYEFKYKPEAPSSTQDFDTTYRGIMADEYPEVMHYNGRIFNPINAFGELMLAVKALGQKVDELEARI